MPVGAIVFVEHWIFPKIGLTQFWASRKKLLVNWPALLSWGIAIAVAITLQRTGTLHLFFLFVPVWLLTSVLYIIFASMAGAREKFDDQTNELSQNSKSSAQTEQFRPAGPQVSSKDSVMWICGIVALASLLACLILSIRVYTCGGPGYTEALDSFKRILIVPTLIYFVFGTAWIFLKDKKEH
jgi:cytosine permease